MLKSYDKSVLGVLLAWSTAAFQRVLLASVSFFGAEVVE